MATNKGQKGGLVKGKSHATGGVKSVIVDTNKPIELEGGEAVINKTTVRSSKLYDFQNQKLTAKEILSKLNIDGGGVPIGSECEGSFEKGGIVENNPLDTKLSKYDFLDWQLYDEFITQKENGFYVYTDNLFILTFNENKDHSKDYKQAVNQDLIINQLKKDGLFEKYGQFIIDAYSNVSYKKFNKEDARRLINNDTIVYLFSQNKLNSSSLESVFYRDNTESKQEQNIDEIEVIEEVIQDKSNDKPSAESKQRFSAVKEVNRNDIMLMPELFQGRPKAYSENSVDKIVSEGFDKTNDPIVTWWNPETEKHVVISGHSRFEASKRLYEKGDESLETMPIKEFLGDRQEAKLYALFESNRASDQEGLLADIKAVKLMIEEGYNKAEMLKNIKPNSYLEKILSYTYLNLDGRFIEYLTQPSSTSFPYLERNAGWVGDLKKFHKGKLTDAHESEIFEYIYQSGGVKGLRQTKDQFFNLINSKVAKLDFDSEKPLNLHNVVSTSAVTSSARQIIKEKQDDIDYFEKEISRKRDLIVRARQENKQDLIPQFEKFITDSSNRIIDLKEQIRKLESDIKGVENQVVFDLFSMSDNSPIMKKIEADIVKKESNDAFDEAKQDSVNEVTECHDELVYFAKNHNKEVIQVGSEISINGSTYNVVSLNSEKLKFKNITDDREITKTFSDLMSLFNKGLISFDGYNNNDKALFDLMIKSKQICIIREEDYKALTGTIDYSTEKISTLTNALKELLSQKEAIEIELGSVERNNEELTSEISIQKQKEADILKTEELESETIEQQRLLAIQDLESKESKKQAYLDKIEVYSEMVLNCKNKKKELEKEKETARYLSGKKKGSWGLSTEADKKRSAKVSAKIESYKTNCGNIEKYEDKIDIYLEMINNL